MNQVPPRSWSNYYRQYGRAIDADGLGRIFDDSERLALSSKNYVTAEGRFHLAIECYYQLHSLLAPSGMEQDLERRMEVLVRGFNAKWAEPPLPSQVVADRHVLPGASGGGAELRPMDEPQADRGLSSTVQVAPLASVNTSLAQDTLASEPVADTPWEAPAAMRADSSGGTAFVQDVVLEPPAIEIESNVCPSVQLAMLVNGLPVVSSVVIANNTNQALRDLQLDVRAEPDFADPTTVRISEIAAGTRQRLDTVKLDLNAGFLDSVTERMPGRLVLDLQGGEGSLLHEEVPIDLCAKSEWPGLQVFPEILASFVLPNEAFVQQLLREAAGFLQRWTGDPSLGGYQARDPQRVMKMAGAVYAALQSSELSYVSPPASFADHGQRVRLPREIGEFRLATCLDVALLAAACLEQALAASPHAPRRGTCVLRRVAARGGFPRSRTRGLRAGSKAREARRDRRLRSHGSDDATFPRIRSVSSCGGATPGEPGSVQNLRRYCAK